MQRPLPLDKALDEDTLLAYSMNGEPLPPDHGFPARVVVPGWVGAASVKWVGRIRVSEQPLRVRANTEEYVLVGPDHAPGDHAPGPPLTTQVPKSAVALPWPAELRAGTQRVVGWAWSPFGTIERVDVSLDGGRTFRSARLLGPNEPRAGTRWDLTFLAEPGRMSITPRARDSAGHQQPRLREQLWNAKGYLFGAMVAHPVRVWR
jgi:DMSO/TMAO reductase YedYZ molybdopterin-dependent catalytic subunit